MLAYLNSRLIDKYKVIALVHSASLVSEYKNIEYIEFHDSIKSYFLRIYYEYFYFKKLSKQIKPYLWFYLHDMTPNVKATVRAVYCHNPTPFYKTKILDFFKDPKVYLFSKFYKYLYAVNIKRNNYVIVQQEWIGNEFKNIYSVDNIVVTKPQVPNVLLSANKGKEKKHLFFYPSFPRSFKNFEIICEATKILNNKGINDFKVVLTIDGSENNYAKKIVDEYKNIASINFVGLLSREEVFKYYSLTNTLIFPSKLETWGLPISEFQTTRKPILVADLPYAYETVGNYEKVIFFDPYNAENLALLMHESLEGKITYSANKTQPSNNLRAENWEDLFSILLN